MMAGLHGSLLMSLRSREHEWTTLAQCLSREEDQLSNVGAH